MSEELHFNLLISPWIPVLWNDGRFSRIGIQEALTRSGEIRQIAASNPMDRVALLRFLLSVLMWCRENAKSCLASWDQSSAGVPETWLARLKEHDAAFNLLGDGDRFYQDNSLMARKSRPIGDLLAEFPTETKIAHFRHVRDMEYGFCPACCALGIIRFCAFANYAGKGYTSGINGTAPAYAISLGSTLLKTLWLNCPEDKASSAKPPWLSSAAPKLDELDIPSVFAWRSRRIWLRDAAGEGVCASCSGRTDLIWKLAFAGGWPQPFQTNGQERKFWHEDPHLLMVNDAAIDEDADDNEIDTSSARKKKSTQTALGFPRPGNRISTHAGFWRRALSTLLSTHPAAQTILVVGPAATQTGLLYQDAAALHLCIPSDRSSSIAAVEAQQKAMNDLRSILRISTPNPKMLHPNRDAAFNTLSPLIETSLRSDTERRQDADLAHSLRECLNVPVEHVVRSNTPGSPLRRYEALNDAHGLLDEHIKKLVQSPGQPSTADSTPVASATAKTGPSKRGAR